MNSTKALFNAALMLTIALLLSAQARAEDKDIIADVMSWYTPIGALNGVTSWLPDGYRYENRRRGEDHRNFPLPPSLVLPPTLTVGSDEYENLQFEAAKQELIKIKSAGFNVAVFDMQPWPAYDPTQPIAPKSVPFDQWRTFLSWLKAGESVGIRVGFSPDVQNRTGDYPQGYKLSADEWVRNLAGAYDQIKGYPALWRIGGKPVLIHFGTSVQAGQAPPVPGDPEPDGGWRKVISRLKAAGKNYYFIADIRPNDAHIEQWNQIADAVYNYSPAAPGSYLADMQPVLAKTLSIPLIWVVSPGYYNQGIHAYTQPDFERIHRAYMEAMANGVRQLEFLTWNDFGEDTDITPSANKGNCLYDIVSYYNAWFSNGRQPAVSSEKVILAYPVAIPAYIASRAPAWGNQIANRMHYKIGADALRRNPAWGDWKAPEYTPKVFYWSLLKGKRTLEIPDVGTVELPPGLSMGEMGIAKAGPVNAKLAGFGITLPPILGVQDEHDAGLHYRYVNLFAPPPAP